MTDVLERGAKLTAFHDAAFAVSMIASQGKMDYEAALAETFNTLLLATAKQSVSPKEAAKLEKNPVIKHTLK
eukprot:5848621-Heterocapsa_arctica.AAC.1